MRYPHIASDLRRRVLEGEFSPGSRLPSEQRLAGHYQVSRGVIRNALAALSRRGMIVSHPGAGWHVPAHLQTQEFTELRSFAQWAEARHLAPSGRVISQARVPANERDARILRTRLGEEILRVTRLRSLDGHPVMVERTSYAPWVIPAIEPLAADEPSVTKAMGRAGISMVYGEHRIDTVSASGEDAQLLGVRRSLRLMRVQRETYARDGRPIEHGDDRYAPDTVTFEVHSTASTQLVAREEASSVSPRFERR